MIKICKWKYNAMSPVMFMIDDLCNSWVDSNRNGKIDLGEDFGAGMRTKNSSFLFLEEKLLKDFPWVKVNFYVPVGKRIGMLANAPIRMYSAPINANAEIKKFFKSIHDNQKYELSYHGITHGKVFDKAKDQKQEWECFNNLEQAIATIDRGKNIFKDVTGEFPKGGKYCGYIGDTYGDQSIDKTNFFWWHRFWNRGIEDLNYETKFVGNEKNPLKAYDIQEFGENKIIDIPSTVNGAAFSLKSDSKIKSLIKKILSFYFIKREKSKIDFLLENKLVISIQEHICPARDDGKIQKPNIFDDLGSLQQIFSYLKSKNVWYCTGTELAEYYYLRKYLGIVYKDDKFEFDMKKIKKDIINKIISLEVENNVLEILAPDCKVYKKDNGIITVPVMEGNYIIKYTV